MMNLSEHLCMLGEKERLTRHACLAFLFPGPDPSIACRMFNTLMGERPQIELTLYRCDFGFSSVSGAWKRHGCDATSTANDGSAALDEGPVPKLAGRLLQLGLRVHHDRSVPGDGFPEAVLDEQKPDSFFAGLDRYLVATVEENERHRTPAMRSETTPTLRTHKQKHGVRFRPASSCTTPGDPDVDLTLDRAVVIDGLGYLGSLDVLVARCRLQHLWRPLSLR